LDTAYNSRSSFALEVLNLSKIYESPSGDIVGLQDINFVVGRGEFVSVVGPSGSGKTTLLNMLGALERPTTGNVFIDGIDVFSLSDSQLARLRCSQIGFIFQSYNLINRTTVQKNVEFPGIMSGINRNERHRKALKLLEFLGLQGKTQYKPFNLSGGQQQRVAIARALMNNPSIILADEPTGNLDTKTGQEVFNLLKLLTKRYRRTIIMVTHNRELASNTDRSIHIRDGKLESETVNTK
jgi:putative ABC transport system ATP-binding protein